MVKRQLQERGSGSSAQESKRRPNINYLRNVTGGLLPDEIASFVEPLFRKVVYEEVERVISRFHDPSLRAPSNPIGSSEESNLQMRFITKLPAIIFAGSQIKAEDGTPLRIELVDGRTNKRVTSGPLSSIKLKIVVLDGDFGSSGGEHWTEEEFNHNIVCERKGKRPLIIGELIVILQEGTGRLFNLIITDNSSWIRSRKFRLGARAIQRVSTEIRIKEGRSESFVVKDNRGESYKKHYPPSLSDEVWRLQKIAKDGALHERMSSRRINTVRDFLQLHEVDSSSLRNILGTKITKQTWEKIVRHASTCVVDDNKMYAYYQNSDNAGILFNSIMKVTQAILDSQTYQLVDKLTPSQKILVQNLKWQAYNNRNQWLPLDDLPGITFPRALINFPTEPLVNLSPPLHHLDYTVLNQDRPEVTPPFNYSSTSASHCYNVTENRQSDCLGPQSHVIEKIFNPTIVNSLATQDLPSGFSAGESSYHLVHLTRTICSEHPSSSCSLTTAVSTQHSSIS